MLTLNQIRMILRLDQVYGRKTSRDLIPEMAATFGAGLGLRTVARELLDVVPVAGWAVKGAVAYAGTRALGEAAVLRLSEKSTSMERQAAITPRRAGVSRGAP